MDNWGMNVSINQSINQSINLYCKNTADRTQLSNRQTLKKENIDYMFGFKSETAYLNI